MFNDTISQSKMIRLVTYVTLSYRALLKLDLYDKNNLQIN